MAGHPTQASACSSKRLLVVGASSMRESAFAVWRQLGIEVVVVDGYSTGRYEHLANEFAPLDPRDGSADIDAITEIARGCGGITTLADNSQQTVAAIAEDLGLPGVGRAAAAVARSKLRQRELCERGGMPVPRWRHVRDSGDIEDFFADGDRPAVLKPVDGAGSAGVLRVATAAEAIRQWRVVRSLSPSRTVIIEDFLDGREVCVDAVVSGGKPVFVSVCTAEYTGSDGFIAVSANYAADQKDRPVAVAQIQQLASIAGLEETVLQAEFRINDGRWTLVETAFRTGGALVPDLTERVTGVNLYEVQARIALGETPPVPAPAATRPLAPFAQVRFLIGHGQVRRFVPPAKILDGLPDVKIVGQFAGPGQRVRLPLSEEGRAGYATGWGPDRDRLDAQLREAIDRLGRQLGLAVPGTPTGAEVAEVLASAVP